MCIYAIIGVEYFGEFGEGEAINTFNATTGEVRNSTERYYDNMHGAPTNSLTTRGLYYGHEYYGTFARAIFTLFQVRAAPPVRRPSRRRWAPLASACTCQPEHPACTLPALTNPNTLPALANPKPCLHSPTPKPAARASPSAALCRRRC